MSIADSSDARSRSVASELLMRDLVSVTGALFVMTGKDIMESCGVEREHINSLALVAHTLAERLYDAEYGPEPDNAAPGGAK